MVLAVETKERDAFTILPSNVLNLPLFDSHMAWNCLPEFSENRAMVRIKRRLFLQPDKAGAIRPDGDEDHPLKGA